MKGKVTYEMKTIKSTDGNFDVPPEKATIEGWVARNATGKALFFNGKEPPSRPMFEGQPKQWQGSATPVNGIPIIPQSAFPSLTWADEPRKVKIEITLLDEEK